MKKPEHPPKFADVFNDPDGYFKIIRAVQSPTHKGRYLHWDEVRRRRPPTGLTSEEWWFGLKGNRSTQYKSIPLTDVGGKPFVFAVPEEAQALLHEVTQRASGSMGAWDQITNPETRNRYLIRNLMEEGITSSLIEGAATTREAAREMLRSKRAPRDESEQMVLNNYTAMQHIISLEGAPLTPEMVLELHEIITRNTLKDPSGAGRLRRADEAIDVADMYGHVLHDPPPAEQLAGRLEAMCAFANGKSPKGFVHPVLRSIILHFWLAYDHPFKDGNGRAARALFYWSMLSQNYWLCQFISISRIIYQAPTRYARAFLFTESDDNDLTYFAMHQLDVISKALDALHEYIEQKLNERRRIESRLRLSSELNDRQLDLIGHALRHPNAQYGIRQYQTDNSVVYQTARTDLLDLVDKGLLRKTKHGRTHRFHPSPNLDRRLRRL
ncbi:MAG: Fic family protein [Planctomycetes bacterium]|nr:Fic family protein [Planctomycetota bacterium]